MKEGLEVINCPICWPKELMELSILTPEEKSLRMRGNWSLATEVLKVWDEMQSDLQRNDLKRMVDLLEEEMNEYRLAYQEYSGENLKPLDEEKQWYEVDGRRRWKIGSELADVIVFSFSLWKMVGLSESDFEKLMTRGNSQDIFVKEKNKYWFDYLTDLAMIVNSFANSIRVDLAEMVILKTLINYQHRPPFLEAKWRGNGFMGPMRRNIGDKKTTQMDDLGLVIGPTVLAKYIDSENYFKKKAPIHFLRWAIAHEEWLSEDDDELPPHERPVLPWRGLTRI